MPLDIAAMKQAVQVNSTESMSICARCYESVPSFSWCDTCSSALCEFHHQVCRSSQLHHSLTSSPHIHILILYIVVHIHNVPAAIAVAIAGAAANVAAACFCIALSLLEIKDHILSVDTSKKHQIHTFKEIKHKGMQIDYKFAPIACPEVLLQDCSIYCHDCLHLVSSQGMVENHKVIVIASISIDSIT